MKVTLKQIAEKTGVSINTVSLALRGMSNISDETRERVVQAARELGYHKQLKTPAGRRNLCLVSTGMHLQDSYFYMEFYQLFLSYASAHGYTMLAMEAEAFQSNPAEIRERLEQSSIGGILSLGDMKEEMFQNLYQSGLPIVAVGARYYQSPVCTFIEDNQLAAHQAVHFLIENGYKRIGFAGSPLHSIAFSERYFAFRQACYTAGLSVRPEDEWLDLMPEQGAEENERQILARLGADADLPEAFFCAHDLLAISMMKVFRQRGIRVPEHVALIGVDYNPIGQLMEPRLTSVDVCCRAQAEAAVRKLIEFIESGTYLPARILLPTALRVGGTVQDRRKRNRD